MGSNFDPPPGSDNPSDIWEPGKTPKFLLVDVSGVGSCPDVPFPTGPPNRTFCVEQVNPFTWMWEGLYYDCQLILSGVLSAFYIYCDVIARTWFDSNPCPGKTLHFHNQLSCDIPNPGGFGGEAAVNIEGAVCYPTVLMTTMNLFPDTTKMKWDPVGPTPIKQYVFGHKNNEIQCLIKHDGY